MAYKASFDDQFKKWPDLSMNLSDLTWTSYQPFFDLGKRSQRRKRKVIISQKPITMKIERMIPRPMIT